MTNRKKFIYLTVTLLFLSIILGVFIRIDLHYHEKMLSHAGLNYRGYRGEVVEKKEVIIFGLDILFNQILPG